MENFNELSLAPELLETVRQMGFTKPTEIQAKTIPHLLTGGDVLGQSATGSGKTAAYLLPALNEIIKTKTLCLVLVPTRELALQVEEFAKKIIPKDLGIKMATIIGGGSMKHQMRDLSQRPNLIISTPGRLVDHAQRKTVRLDLVKILVLDEADRMLDFGFYPQIQQIVKHIPKKRQTVLLSATFDKAVKKLAQEFLTEPKEVVAGDKHSAPVTIKQEMVEIAADQKNNVLVDELNQRKGSVLIFTRTKHRSDRLCRYLSGYGFKAERIHGDRNLAQRKRAMMNFKSGESRILVATDIAARGLDIAQVAHVINFDLPMQTEDYLHRVGRTGRAGASGSALSFVTPAEKKQWVKILKFSGTHDSKNNTKDDSNETENEQRRPQRAHTPSRNSERRFQNVKFSERQERRRSKSSTQDQKAKFRNERPHQSW